MLSLVVTWMRDEFLIVSKTRQTQKDNYGKISFVFRN